MVGWGWGGWWGGGGVGGRENISVLYGGHDQK